MAVLAVRSADVIVAQTDPPLLGLWVGLLSRVVRKTWIDWTMDLYPEAFAAAGLARHESLPMQALRGLTRFFRADHCIALGPRQLEYLRSTGRCGASGSVLLCGTVAAPPPPNGGRDAPNVSAVYAGNLGEAHDADRVAAAIQGFLAAGVPVHLAPSGKNADELLRLFRDSSNVTVGASVSHAQLATHAFHICSLSKSWTHVAVPSKALTAVSLGRVCIFLGPSESDTTEFVNPSGITIGPDASLSEIRDRCEAIARAGTIEVQPASEHADRLRATSAEYAAESVNIVLRMAKLAAGSRTHEHTAPGVEPG